MTFYADYVYCPKCKIKLYRIVEDLIQGMRISSYHFEIVSVYAKTLIYHMPLPIKCGKCDSIVMDPYSGIVSTENGISPRSVHIIIKISRIIEKLKKGEIRDIEISKYLVHPDERVRFEAQSAYNKKYNQKDER